MTLSEIYDGPDPELLAVVTVDILGETNTPRVSDL